MNHGGSIKIVEMDANVLFKLDELVDGLDSVA